MYKGPFTNWGGHPKMFPAGGFTTVVDIYLDVPYAVAHPDARFDWSSAISDTSGKRLRDFVFNVGTDARGFVISGSNKAGSCEVDPEHPDANHFRVIRITKSAWYRFKHTFTVDPTKRLKVTLTIASTARPDTPLGTWTLSNQPTSSGRRWVGSTTGHSSRTSSTASPSTTPSSLPRGRAFRRGARRRQVVVAVPRMSL